MLDPEQRIIELIEDSPFSPLHKYRLLLTHLGVVRACTISLTSGIWREGSSPKKVDAELVVDAYDILRQIKGVYEATEPKVAPAIPKAPDDQAARVREITAFLVARDTQILGELEAAVEKRDFAKVGLLYGYPQTSVEAVLDHTVISLERLPPATIMTDAVRFLDFPLSEADWPNELAQVREWIDLVRQHSPVIYEQLRMQNFCRLSDAQADSLFGGRTRRRN